MMLPGGVAHAQEALNKANANCSARFNEALSDQTSQAQYRVVYVGTMTGPNKQLSGEVHHTKDDWMNAWADTVVGKVYSNHGAHPTTADAFQDQPSTSANSIVDQHSNDSAGIVVIALNQHEPRPVNYRPQVSTDQQSPAAIAVGATMRSRM